MEFDRALQSIVALHSSIPEDGFTAAALGTERVGSGIVIETSGLVLTIGYLITEADNIWLTSAGGRVTPGHALAYDQETGFGLVQALGRLDLPAIGLGQSGLSRIGDSVVMAGGGGSKFVRTQIIGKQQFAGYWEYLLEEAIFTAPAHPLWGGAGLIDNDGKLLGVGSLLLQQANTGGDVQDINMTVPIDLLPPILDDLLKYGRVNKPPRPWLGMFSTENEGKVIIAEVARRGPAAAAGLRQGDVVTGVRDHGVADLADFYRKVWSCGAAGTEIALEILRDNRSIWMRVKSADRGSFLKKPRMH